MYTDNGRRWRRDGHIGTAGQYIHIYTYIYIYIQFYYSFHLLAMLTWCLYDVGMMFVWCWDDVWMMFGWCLDDVWIMFRWCLGNVWMMCLNKLKRKGRMSPDTLCENTRAFECTIQNWGCIWIKYWITLVFVDAWVHKTLPCNSIHIYIYVYVFIHTYTYILSYRKAPLFGLYVYIYICIYVCIYFRSYTFLFMSLITLLRITGPWWDIYQGEDQTIQ